jgi:hypothetical protein
MRPASIASEEICSFSKLRGGGCERGGKVRDAPREGNRGVRRERPTTRVAGAARGDARVHRARSRSAAGRRGTDDAKKSSLNPATAQTLEKTSRPRQRVHRQPGGCAHPRRLITARDCRVRVLYDHTQRALPRAAAAVVYAGGWTRARHPALDGKTRCETRRVWPYLTRCTQAGKRLQSYFFMPLWVESQGKGVVVVSVRLPRACEARERRVARVAGDLRARSRSRDAGGSRAGRHLRIVNADLGIRDTTAVPALGVRLVLNNAVALGGTARHGDGGSLPCSCERGRGLRNLEAFVAPCFLAKARCFSGYISNQSPRFDKHFFETRICVKKETG